MKAMVMAVLAVLMFETAAQAGTIHGIGGVRLGMSKADVEAAAGPLRQGEFGCYGRGEALVTHKDVRLDGGPVLAYVAVCVNSDDGVEFLIVLWGTRTELPIPAAEAVDSLRADVVALGVMLFPGRRPHSFVGLDDEGTLVRVWRSGDDLSVGISMSSKAFLDALPRTGDDLN